MTSAARPCRLKRRTNSRESVVFPDEGSPVIQTVKTFRVDLMSVLYHTRFRAEP